MRALRVNVSADDEDAATTALWDAGTAGVELRALPEGRLELVAYFPEDASPEDALRSALPGASVEAIAVPDVDWVARFREGFRAFGAGGFRVVPTWDAPVPAPDLLVVDPGRAFGTGTHETTRLCLAAIEDLSARRPLGRTLDLGSGTGLLAVAAARRGARFVVASDLDPEATSSSATHSRLNGVTLRVVRADGGSAFRGGRFDLVLANLMAPLLVERSAEIRALVSPGGALVLSGLLVGDVADVAASYAAAGVPQERRDGEWAALVFGAGA